MGLYGSRSDIQMPLLDDSLTIWEIGFRWADRDPGFPWLRIPTEVKDNFRAILGAVERGELYCGSLCDGGFPSWPEDIIRERRKTIVAYIEGRRYERKFLKRHEILHWEFAKWCDQADIAFPEFWFPSGWTTDEPSYPASLPKTKGAKQLAPAAGAVEHPESSKATSGATTERARQAAFKKHEPVQKLKEELFAFWDAGTAGASGGHGGV